MAVKTGQGVPQDSAKSSVKRFAGIICLLGIAVICSVCGDIPATNVAYTFDNKSSYGVSVTLDKIYKTKVINGEDTEYVKSESKTLSVYSGSESTVYVDSENVDFSWTSHSEGNNKNIYCVVDRNKATFRNR